MNVKKGDLAEIKNDSFPENIGRIVSVMEAITMPEAWMAPSRQNWRIECASDLKIGAYPTYANPHYGKIAVCRDEDLRPILPPGREEEVRMYDALPNPVKEQV